MKSIFENLDVDSHENRLRNQLTKAYENSRPNRSVPKIRLNRLEKEEFEKANPVDRLKILRRKQVIDG